MSKNAVHKSSPKGGHDESGLGSILEASRNEMLPPHPAEYRGSVSSLVWDVRDERITIRTPVYLQLLDQDYKETAVNEKV